MTPRRQRQSHGASRHNDLVPTHPTAPERSSEALKTRIANFMRRADDVLNHPLVGHAPSITVTFTLDREN